MSQSIKKDKSDSKVKTIQSVDRALDILECLCLGGNSFKLGELAERCQLNKTTAFHILKTMEARGFVEQSYDTQVYKIGWRGFETFAGLYNNIDVKPIIVPYMDRIRDLTDETVTLYYYSKVNDYYACTNFLQLESSQSLKFSSKLGSRAPIHCTAAGKVRFLGYSPKMLEEQLASTPYDVYTPRTVTDPSILRAQIEEIRQTGYCIECEEYLPGICSVAVPMFKYTDRVIYSICVSIPSSRAGGDRLKEIANIMMDVLQDATSCPDFLFKGAPIRS